VDYEGFFKQHLDALHAEGRYRVFADLERCCGRFRAPSIIGSAPR
jgi:5-aminolevulinate synthase